MIIKDNSMKKIYTCLLIGLLGLSIYGCGLPLSQTNNLSNTSNSLQTTPAQQESTLIFYLPSDDGLHIIPHTIKTISKNNTATEALKEMIRADKNATYPLLPTGLTINNVTVSQGIATVDFSRELKNLSKGSTTELLFIAMTVNTLTEFPNIHAVTFSINGTPITYLNGHPELTKPLKRDES